MGNLQSPHENVRITGRYIQANHHDRAGHRRRSIPRFLTKAGSFSASKSFLTLRGVLALLRLSTQGRRLLVRSRLQRFRRKQNSHPPCLRFQPRGPVWKKSLRPAQTRRTRRENARLDSPRKSVRLCLRRRRAHGQRRAQNLTLHRELGNGRRKRGDSQGYDQRRQIRSRYLELSSDDHVIAERRKVVVPFWSFRSTRKLVILHSAREQEY